MERQQIIKQLYENSKLSYDNMNDREICNLLIEQNKYIEELYEIYNYELAKYNSKFEEEKKDLKLQFRGSSNQRIIDVPETLKTGRTAPPATRTEQ